MTIKEIINACILELNLLKEFSRTTIDICEYPTTFHFTML